MYKQHENIASLHQTRFATTQQRYLFEDSAAIAQKLINVIALVRKLKTEQQLSLKTVLISLTIYSDDDDLLSSLQKHEQLIKGVTQAQEVKYKVDTLEYPSLESIDGFWHAKINA